MKRILQLVLMLCTLFIMTASAFAAESLIDNARLLNAQERTAVQSALRQVESAYGVRAAVVTFKDSKVTDIGKYANTFLDRNYTNGTNGNMVLMINMATRKWYIATDKKMSQRISPDYGIKLIGNNTAIGLKNAKYKDAFTTYARTTSDMLAYYKQNGKAKEAPKTAAAPAKKEKGSNAPMAAGGGILAGILGAMGYGSSLKKSMSNIASATRADQYMVPGSFKLNEKDDTFMYFTYTRVPKNKHRDDDDDDHFENVDDSMDSSDDDHDGAGGGF